MWDFYLDILIPSNLSDKQANANVSFLPTVDEPHLLCHRIHLCRGISKNGSPVVCPRSLFDGFIVALVPRRDLSSYCSSPEALVLSSDCLGGFERSPIRLNLNCKPPTSNNNPFIVVRHDKLTF